ncbi:recombinase family protein [Cohnella endophytica]|uniref:Recombinase family protein n=1 Tax=Cohnella endophytica TaxID=2419778 RepID=A0A494XU80_9BACL|nr:recombinase family protein [Cohnella endophytica]RKP54128.1 recombinase family protein [Cohnella endophytica]
MFTSQKIKCAIYARVSTDRQGESIENQVSQCQEYISRLDGTYDTSDCLIYRDVAVSGYYTSVFDRAEMKQAIRDARENKFKLLVFKEVSRVGRDKQENPAIIGMFEQYGVRVVAINDNYDSLNKDNITFDILSVLSEQESKKISSRVSSARKQKARRGQWGGEPPLGYFVNPENKKLEIDEEWSPIPRLIFDLYVNHGLGTFKVAEHLNNQGIQTKNGFMWSREAINRIIRNQAYIGSVIHGTRRNKLKREYEENGKMSKKKIQLRISKDEWQIVENAHDAIVDKHVFYQAQQILLSKSHHRTPRRAYHPLTGILFCGECGQGMVCQKRSHKGKTYRYYICKTYHKYGRNKCSQANINADELEGTIVKTIRRKLETIPSELFSVTVNHEFEMQRLNQEIVSRTNKQEKLKKEQLDFFKQRELFEEKTYQNEMINKKRQIEALNDEIEVSRRQLENLNTETEKSAKYVHLLKDFCRLELTEERMRKVLHELINKVTFNKEHVTIEYFFDFEGCSLKDA